MVKTTIILAVATTAVLADTVDSANWTGLVTALIVLVNLLIGVVQAWKLREQGTSIAGLGVKVEEVRHATNSLTDKLVASTAKESHAAGVKEEKGAQELRTLADTKDQLVQATAIVAEETKKVADEVSKLVDIAGGEKRETKDDQ